MSEGVAAFARHMFFRTHATVPCRTDPVCFMWDQFLEPPMSGGVLGHQLLGEAEKVA